MLAIAAGGPASAAMAATAVVSAAVVAHAERVALRATADRLLPVPMTAWWNQPDKIVLPLAALTGPELK